MGKLVKQIYPTMIGSLVDISNWLDINKQNWGRPFLWDASKHLQCFKHSIEDPVGVSMLSLLRTFDMSKHRGWNWNHQSPRLITLLYHHYPDQDPMLYHHLLLHNIALSGPSVPCPACQADSADPQQLRRIQAGAEGKAPSNLTRLGGGRSGRDRHELRSW